MLGRDYVLKKCEGMDALHIGDPGCFSDRALGSREQEEPTGEACSWERGARMASPRHPHCLGNARAYYVGPFPDKGSQCAHTRVYMHTCTHTHLPLLPWSFPFLCCWEGAGRCFPSSFTETRCAQHIPCPAAPSVQRVPSRCHSPRSAIHTQGLQPPSLPGKCLHQKPISFQK